jgi:Ca-activated chloride channel family protein
MRSLVLAAGLALVALVVAPLTQSSTGTVSGTVTDAAGNAVPGAAIRVEGNGLPTYSTVSDPAGAFTIRRIPVAQYSLTATLAGFIPYTTRISIVAQQTIRVKVLLRPAGLNEKVEVTGAPPPAPPLAGPAAQLDARLEMKAAARTIPGGIIANSPRPWPGARRRTPGDSNTESYDRIDDNPFRRAAQDPLSTFSIDVDTASYANVRRFLNGGSVPPADAVRIEEMINYFRFDYPRPANSAPFAVTTDLAACPWNPAHRLALIGLQAQPVDLDEVPARNLVFLLDVSGSMQPADKLPLVRTAMRMLVDTLTARDRIAIVVYAGASGIVLPSTSGAHKERIHEAIGRLEAGGSTNGAEGITLAYQVAQEQFVKGGINRVILATDGDFNVGVTNQGDLTRLIEAKRASGIYLSVLGVGTGNVKDSTMEKLADRGNGNYAYLDSLHEARKVLVNEGGATLVTVAKDVKIQVEFNPANVAAYRLIGYENRMLMNQDFNDDLKDAGEIGAGHTVTALYEIVPAGAEVSVPGVDPLKYQRPAPSATRVAGDELMTVKLRYKAPDGDVSKLIAVPVKNQSRELSGNIGFAAAVAEFGMLLRGSEHRGASSYASASALARRFRGPDPDGYRAEFVRLVELAGAVARQKPQTQQ